MHLFHELIICYLMMCWGLIPPISIISISFLVIPVIVCFGDGLLQRMTNYESSNIKRFVFGVAAGYGMYCLISINNWEETERLKRCKRFICIFLCIVSLMQLTACSSNNSSSDWDRQVEKTKNELYYKGPDGKWYPK